MSLFTGAAVLGSALAAGGASIYGAKKVASSADRGAAAQTQGAREALAYTKDKDAAERADKLAAERANYQQWAAREQRMKPYRSAGQSASQTIAGLMGLPAVDIPDPAPPPDYLTAAPSQATAASQAPARPAVWGAGNEYVGTMGALMPGMTMMQMPGGPRVPVANARVAYAQSKGAKVVQ